jgi:hypothetical protein
MNALISIFFHKARILNKLKGMKIRLNTSLQNLTIRFSSREKKNHGNKVRDILSGSFSFLSPGCSFCTCMAARCGIFEADWSVGLVRIVTILAELATNQY